MQVRSCAAVCLQFNVSKILIHLTSHVFLGSFYLLDEKDSLIVLQRQCKKRIRGSQLVKDGSMVSGLKLQTKKGEPHFKHHLCA